MEVIQLSLFGKMFPERSVQTAEKTSAPCWKNLPAWNNQTLQFLDLRGGADGAKPEQSPETDGAWLGDSSTLNSFRPLTGIVLYDYQIKGFFKAFSPPCGDCTFFNLPESDKRKLSPPYGDGISYTWDQGHYFCDLKSAKKFFAEQERNNANCKYCEKLDCPHRDCVRRLPYEKGGILACENLW